MRRGSVPVMILIVLLLGVSFAPASAAGRHVDWPAYLRGPAHTSYQSSETAVTPVNATKLAAAWSFVPPPPGDASGLTGFLSSPTVYDGVVYIGAQNGDFYAVDETSGDVLWKDSIGYITRTTCYDLGFVSTATVALDPTTSKATIYVATPTGYLDAIDAATGALDWQAVIGIPSTSRNDYFDWSSPTVVGGAVYIGIASECDEPLVWGGLIAFSQSTGKRLGVFHAVPRGQVGGSIWSSAAVNPSGEVFVTTGNGPSSDQTLAYSESIVGLTPRTLGVVGSWQIPPPGNGDSDFGGSPTLFQASQDGSTTHMVGACNKNGVYYALNSDDLSAGPVWSLDLGDSAVGTDECVAAAAYDGSSLFIAGPAVTAGSKNYAGSIQEVDPSDGAIVWRTLLNSAVDGTPALDGAGVLAVPAYEPSRTGDSPLYLLNASTGAVITELNTTGGAEFAQPVFADNMLLVATTSGLTAYTMAAPARP